MTPRHASSTDYNAASHWKYTIVLVWSSLSHLYTSRLATPFADTPPPWTFARAILRGTGQDT